jgi:hypothetical protein
MWRLLPGCLALLAGVLLWTGLRGTGVARPAQMKGDCCVIQTINYGGNLICHQRLSGQLIGCGNNALGQERIEAMRIKCCPPKK